MPAPEEGVEVTESAQVETDETSFSTENKACACEFCGESTDLDIPESYASDLKWVCPKCQGTNVLEGQGPAGVPEELKSVTPHLQSAPPPDED
jgi:transposase-like protein